VKRGKNYHHWRRKSLPRSVLVASAMYPTAPTKPRLEEYASDTGPSYPNVGIAKSVKKRNVIILRRKLGSAELMRRDASRKGVTLEQRKGTLV
jgi:hypothetical protein